MNREDILSMIAGKELDVLVTEKIMQWHRVDMTPINNSWFWSNGEIQVAWETFSPSIELTAAWIVIEKMHELDWKCTHTFFSPSARMIGHHAEYWKGSGGWMKSKSATAETFPLAVCKAALLALFEKEEK